MTLLSTSSSLALLAALAASSSAVPAAAAPAPCPALLSAEAPEAIPTAVSLGADVLVYGSTPGAVISAVAAARQGASTILLDPAPRVGGMCSGGLGRTDRGNSIVIGGFAQEFFERNRQHYHPNQTLGGEPGTVCQPDTHGTDIGCGFYLEPHVAEEIFLEMLADAGVQHVRTNGSQVDSVAKEGTQLKSLTLEDGSTYRAKVFIAGTYEGDLMARSGSSFTWGREANTTYNESLAGRGEPYGRMDHGEFSPYAQDGTLITDGGLITDEFAAPKGSGDTMVQGYNFRLCTTQDKSNMVPWPKPAKYNRSEWTLLFKYAAMPINQGKTVPGQGGLGGNNHGDVPNGKHDMNNGGLISTDCAGCSWLYPNSTYSERKTIHKQHVDYQQGFLWTLAHDQAIPKPVQDRINAFGLCKDEFVSNDNWPEQLYVREARRLIGDEVFTQNDVLAMHKYSETNESAGMGSYNFDAHYSHRGPCLPTNNPVRPHADGEKGVGQSWSGPSACRMLTKDDPPLTLAQKRNNSLVWTGGEGYGGPLKATYELPFSTLLPKRAETTNLLCPLTPSASHLALATLRMEPQFMTMGHTAGVAAALAAKAGVAVQDVDRAALAAILLAQRQILSAAQMPGGKPVAPGKARYVCAQDRCFQSLHAPANSSGCDQTLPSGKCSKLKPAEWLALKQHWELKSGAITSVQATALKKSELNSRELPPAEERRIVSGTVVKLTAAPKAVDDTYWLVVLAGADTGAPLKTSDNDADPAAVRTAATASVWPPPRSFTASGPPRLVDPALTITVAGSSNAVLDAGIGRYVDTLRGASGSSAPEWATATEQQRSGALGQLRVRIEQPGVTELSFWPGERGTDYSYELMIDAASTAVLTARTAFGALYGLESFAQLLMQAGGLHLNGTAIHIVDSPAYIWRGLMIDCGRRFWPVSVVKNTLDTMAAVKLNVLHMHASDHCRWAVESKLFPQLTNNLTGSYAGHYTQADIKELVAYARARGIRVVPEFDLPAHARGLLSLDSQTGGAGTVRFCQTKDVGYQRRDQLYDTPATRQTLSALLSEMADLFGDPVLHIGGDETYAAGPCTRNTTKSLQKFLCNAVTTGMNRTVAGWEELLFDAGAASPHAIIQAWGGYTPPNITKMGRYAINSISHHLYTGPDVGPGKPGPPWLGWARSHYDIAEGVPSDERKLLLGGEMAYWTDAYCPTLQCGAFGGPPQPARAMFPPSQDEAFGKSVGGILWPWGYVGAGSLWNYDAAADPTGAGFVARIYKLNDQLAARGSTVCPSRCNCTELASCGQPYVAAANGAAETPSLKSDDSNAVDLTVFETTVLPRWLKQFQIVGLDGQPVEGAFRQSVGGSQRAYGTADVVHLLSTVNQLNFSEAKRDIWAAELASFQNLSVVCAADTCPGLPVGSSWPGFYELGDSHDDTLSSGGEPWHSTGDITSSFHLLKRWPKALNPMYKTIASNHSLWEATFLPTGKDKNTGILAIHKIIGILGTLLMQEPNAKKEYAPFLEWWARFIDAHEEKANGFLCDITGVPQCKCTEPLCTGERCLAEKLKECVAPTFATNMIKHIGLNWTWPNNRTAQRTILDLQLPSGFWGSSHTPGYHEIDSLFITVRTLPWNEDRRPEVQAACAAFLKAITTFGEHDFNGKGLNDPALVEAVFRDTHSLAAPVFAVSMCAQEFPQLVKTQRPWTFSGNRAPFI